MAETVPQVAETVPQVYSTVSTVEPTGSVIIASDNCEHEPIHASDDEEFPALVISRTTNKVQVVSDRAIDENENDHEISDSEASVEPGVECVDDGFDRSDSGLSGVQQHEELGLTEIPVDKEEGDELVCHTMDFAVQNVLTAMGIRIEGKRKITTTKRWTLRCRCCKMLTNQTDSPFCRSCGYADLHRVQVMTDENGTEHVLLRKNYRVNLRGTIFAPSQPKGGKHADKNCLRRPDEIYMGGRINDFRRKLKLQQKENANSSLVSPILII